jgi:hypothetical protein
MGKAKSATVSSELGLKVESGVDLLSGSSARQCVVCVCIYFLRSGVSLVCRVVSAFGSKRYVRTVVKLKIATYGCQEA